MFGWESINKLGKSKTVLMFVPQVYFTCSFCLLLLLQFIGRKNIPLTPPRGNIFPDEILIFTSFSRRGVFFVTSVQSGIQYTRRLIFRIPTPVSSPVQASPRCSRIMGKHSNGLDICHRSYSGTEFAYLHIKQSLTGVKNE